MGSVFYTTDACGDDDGGDDGGDDNGGDAPINLFISEYIEGSSNNSWKIMNMEELVLMCQKVSKDRKTQKQKILTETKPCVFLLRNHPSVKKSEPKLKTWPLEPLKWEATLKSLVFVVWDSRFANQQTAGQEQELA